MITPSATRGASSNSTSSRGNGKLPSAIIRASRSNTSKYWRSSEPARRPNVSGVSRVTSPIRLPSHRTGMHLIRARSVEPSALVSPSTISPSRHARLTSGRSTSPTTVPTMSSVYSVWSVVGRTWPSTTNRWPSSPSMAARNKRSAKQRSASTCQDAMSRRVCASAAPPRAVFVRANSNPSVIASPVAVASSGFAATVGKAAVSAQPMVPARFVRPVAQTPKRASPMRASPATS